MSSTILEDSAACPTLYLNRLDERVHVDSLKPLLFELCSQFGLVIDVVAAKTLRKKGQAFVVFSDTTSATIALKHLRRMQFLGRPIVASFARNKSDATARYEGTYKPKPFTNKRRAQGSGMPMSFELAV